MPWKDKTVEKLRKEFCQAVAKEQNISKVCREFGITRRTGYKWLGRSDMQDQSRCPKRRPNKTTPEVEVAILDVRAEHPAWGGKTILQVLRNDGHTKLPCVKTANNILKRNGCISEQASLAATPYQRFEREFCNDLWQADFKGDFALADGTRCYPLDILDDHSRFALKIQASSNMLGTKDTFREAFLEFGMPNSILTDNGSTFCGPHGGYTQFERWLMEHDILPIHGRFFHPQTQGKIERFHRTMKAELLKGNTFSDIEHARVALEDWRQQYNGVRPHHALNMKCPAEIYLPSKRIYTDAVEPFDYDSAYQIIKANSWGYLRFANFQVYLSETMANTYIQLRASEDGNSFFAHFRNFKIAQFDAHSGNRLNRKISRA